ncbi:hypothetical protein [Fuchsiella alkaliacetigena]|uniref:hypothetical protein n=1 Tax=Fuchsiella alkaliacetigena TaxID=957042 RepID=UPI00200A0FAD|nr:hypothetical protein [Fuchsiella alkaliacetigena]MCK8824877.1 hypothetical protein [Fuchsiella alkaliacetigena]
MNISKLKSYYNRKAVIDNNILTDFIELTAVLKEDYMFMLNELFTKVIIPTPILDDENIHDNLGSLEYEAGVFQSELGYEVFMELGDWANNKTSKQLSEYDRYVIAIAAEMGILVVSNDGPIRKTCKKYSIEVTGTLGVICSAYENDLISFEVMKKGLKFLFSDESSCYLSLGLREEIFDYYSIKD